MCVDLTVHGTCPRCKQTFTTQEYVCNLHIGDRFYAICRYNKHDLVKTGSKDVLCTACATCEPSTCPMPMEVDTFTHLGACDESGDDRSRSSSVDTDDSREAPRPSTAQADVEMLDVGASSNVEERASIEYLWGDDPMDVDGPEELCNMS
jgi:hypothetical protein